MNKKTMAVVFIVFFSLNVEPLIACNELTKRDVDFWYKMYNEPRELLFPSEPESFTSGNKVVNELNSKGIRAFNMGDYPSSRRYFSEALKINPELASLNYNLALAEHLIAYNDSKLEKVAVLLRKASMLEPGNPRYRYFLAAVLSYDGKTDEAIKEYIRLLGITGNKHTVYNNIGQLYEFRGDLLQAAVNYEKAIELNRGYKEALYNLGRVFERMGKPGEAGRIYRELVEISPDDADVYVSLGRVYSLSGMYHFAVESYKEAIKLRNDRPDIRIMLSEVYRTMGWTKEAEEEEYFANALSLGLNPVYLQDETLMSPLDRKKQ